jgi:hypothetical protein
MPLLIDIYYHEKKKNTYRFISQDLSVYEAEEYFKKAMSQGKRIEALLITPTGNSGDKLLGIIKNFGTCARHYSENTLQLHKAKKGMPTI